MNLDNVLFLPQQHPVLVLITMELKEPEPQSKNIVWQLGRVGNVKCCPLC